MRFLSFNRFNEEKLIKKFALISDDTSLIPKCILYDDEVNINEKILDYDFHDLKLPEQPKLDASKSFEVKIVHTESNPFNFYVQLENDAKNLKSMRLKLDKFESPTVSEVLMDDLVIVKNHGIVHRGLVIENVGPTMFKVFSVDHGFTEQVAQHRMTLISEELAAFAPFAYRCRLNNCEKFKSFPNAEENFKNLFETAPVLTMKVLKEVDGYEPFYVVDFEMPGNKTLSQKLMQLLEEIDGTEESEDQQAGKTLIPENDMEIHSFLMEDSPEKIDENGNKIRRTSTGKKAS